MKEQHYFTKSDYEKYRCDDTRYYGLFYSGKKDNLTVKIDPKRFQAAAWHSFTQAQLSVINSRQTHYFRPAKKAYTDYNCNKFETEMKALREYWNKHFQPLIQYAKQQVEKPKELTPGDCDLLACGILEADEANMWAHHENLANDFHYQEECAMVVASMYAQFIQHMASRIESVTVKVLTIAKSMDDHFDRNILYATAVNSEITVKELPSFVWYDRLYSLWNFIKHNSQSTYETVQKCYPQALAQREYHQGDLAACIIVFSDEMITELINGVSRFFKEYCELVFREKYEEAQWNYCRYFLDIVYEKIELFTNPLGIPYYL